MKHSRTRPRAPRRGGQLPCPRRRNQGGTFVLTLLILFTLCILGAGVYMLTHPEALMPARQPATPQHTQQQHGQPATTAERVQAKPRPFCQRDFTARAQRREDLTELAAAGGLVHLLKRKQARAPFECAAYYLGLGLDVDATGPAGLTALHYAIKDNNPKMLQFVIKHGADLHKKAGDKQLNPMSYAYYLALNHPQTNRNPIIKRLNKALVAAGQ